MHLRIAYCHKQRIIKFQNSILGTENAIFICIVNHGWRGEQFTRPGKSFVVFGQNWCDMSVLGSQVFGQGSMESCAYYLVVKIIGGGSEWVSGNYSKMTTQTSLMKVLYTLSSTNVVHIFLPTENTSKTVCQAFSFELRECNTLKTHPFGKHVRAHQRLNCL